MKVPSKIKVAVKVRNGKFASNQNLVRSILESYEGLTIDIEFRKRTNKRSNRQNSYHWGVIIPITQNCIKIEWGEIMGANEVHEFLKHNCNYVEEVNEETGEVLRRVKGTTENSTTDQEQFHENCRRLVKDFFNTKIPLPNEDLTLKF